MLVPNILELRFPRSGLFNKRKIVIAIAALIALFIAGAFVLGQQSFENESEKKSSEEFYASYDSLVKTNTPDNLKSNSIVVDYPDAGTEKSVMCIVTDGADIIYVNVEKATYGLHSIIYVHQRGEKEGLCTIMISTSDSKDGIIQLSFHVSKDGKVSKKQIIQSKRIS